MSPIPVAMAGRNVSGKKYLNLLTFRRFSRQPKMTAGF
jgi:hypothetical protein